MNRYLIASIAILQFTLAARGEVPQQINHQGVVRVAGVPFNGTGLFKFAIVDPDTEVNLWTNDGTNEGTSAEPLNPVSLQVTGGVYSVGLGESSLPFMTTMTSAVFNDDNVVLRIWFDDGTNGSQQLMPDQPLTSAPYAHRAATGVPVGTIVAYAGSTAPDGWHLCDGSTRSRTGYADLFAAINTAWGEGDASTTFNLPDLRGRFLRGVDGGTGRDPDAASRSSSNPGGNDGDLVGSIQFDATARPRITAFATNSTGAHSHTLTAHVLNGSGPQRLAGAVGNAFPDTVSTSSAPNHSHSIPDRVSSPSTGGGDTETRPVNAYVNYIIKD